MRSMPWMMAMLAAALFSPAMNAQQREPLTEAEIDQIREAGIYPDERVKLYTKFIEEHVATVKDLANRPKSAARGKRLEDELEDIADLMDEFGSNLDVFSERHSDIRKSLKDLNEATDGWLATLRAVPEEPPFDLARKDAMEAEGDLAEQAKHLSAEQTEYFDAHKDERGQERAEPK